MDKAQLAFLRLHTDLQTLNRFTAQGHHGFTDEGEERAFLQPMIESGLLQAVDTRHLHWPEAWAGTRLTAAGLQKVKRPA